MQRLNTIIANTVFVVQILIAFMLVFEHRIHVPAFLQIFGRLHPMVLHLPIGLLLITTFLLFAEGLFQGTSLNHVTSFMLHIVALTASITTIMGLLLSQEGTFGADQLFLHKWFGVALSFLCWSLLMIESKPKFLKVLSSVGVVVLILTGHFGANLTHGEDFVMAPWRSDDATTATTRTITDSSTVFSAAIAPVFESKCYGCHNTRKTKGNLILVSLESIAKGGKNGDLWKPGDASHSLLVDRLSLPLEDEKHMPPKDKAQLTEDEIYLISHWIDAGADIEIELRDLSESDTLNHLANVIISRYQQKDNEQPLYSFNFLSPEKIGQLNKPSRTVFQIARNEPAVQAEFYLQGYYKTKDLEELMEVKEQLVLLNLSNMPVRDSDLETIAKFQNLEELNLNNTAVKGTGLKALSSLARLRSLSLSGTDVSADALRDLKSYPSLKEVFVWNTSVTNEDVALLERSIPHIRWSVGYTPDENELLKLNLPQVVNKSQILEQEEKVVFKHNLPGTSVHYSMDGTDPDSIDSPVFKGPLSVGLFSRVRVKAFKTGWRSSDVGDFLFFRKGFRPDTAILVTEPDPRFKGLGANTFIDDLKGPPDFFNLPEWIAFKDTDMVLDFVFEKDTPTLKNIAISYARHWEVMALAPDEVEVWGGNSASDLKLITTVRPDRTNRDKEVRIEGVSIDLPSTNYTYYRVVAKPVKGLIDGKGKKRNSWLMVDEMFFN